MAVNIFDKYGIKEVANVYFEALEDEVANGVYAGDIVLYLDSLKVSTIETTAENVAAQGGWGNPKLIQWDYGKEITVTLEDALLSLESLRFMFGGAIKQAKQDEKVLVHHTAQVKTKKDPETGKIVFDLPKHDKLRTEMVPVAWAGHPIKIINLGQVGGSGVTAGTRTQIRAKDTNISLASTGNEVLFKNPKLIGDTSLYPPEEGDLLRIFWDEEVTSTNKKTSAVEVTISPSTFPGTYRVVGDTFMRSEKTGTDEMFQFIIEKAKVSSEVTLTLEAEGDPATFEMTLNVLRSTGDEGNEMMKLIRYTISDEGDAAGNDWGTLNGSGVQSESEHP